MYMYNYYRLYTCTPVPICGDVLLLQQSADCGAFEVLFRACLRFAIHIACIHYVAWH